MRPVYVLQIARFTLHEALSRRLILAGVLISLAYIALFALGFHTLAEIAWALSVAYIFYAKREAK